MPTPEARVKDRIVRLLKQHKAYYFFPVASGFGRSGLFDIVAVVRGHAIGIEVKATIKDMPTLLQTKNALEAVAAGMSVFCLHEDNIDALDSLLRSPNQPKMMWPAKALLTYHEEFPNEVIT